jgi:hypothetical protein
MEDEILGLDFPPVLGPATVELMDRPLPVPYLLQHDSPHPVETTINRSIDRLVCRQMRVIT